VAEGCLGLEECGARRTRGGKGGCVALDDDVASALVFGGASLRERGGKVFGVLPRGILADTVSHVGFYIKSSTLVVCRGGNSRFDEKG